MGFIGPVIVDVIFIIILSVSGWYITKAWWKLSYNSKNDLHNYEQARHFLRVVTIVTWIAVAMIIAVIVAYCIFGSETAEFTGSIFVKALGFLIIASVLVEIILTGFSINYEIRGNIRETQPIVFRNTIISICISGGFLLSYIIWTLIRHHKKKEQKQGK
jgi:magnesium-transporting ATPase (P-type)